MKTVQIVTSGRHSFIYTQGSSCNLTERNAARVTVVRAASPSGICEGHEYLSWAG